MLQIIIILAASLLVGVDQLTKWLAVEHLQEGKPLPVIDGVFELLLHKNPAAAFGLFEGQRWLFMGVTIIVLIIMIAILMSGRYRQFKLVNISGILIIAGGIGNMIDRVRLGYVIDFLYVKLIDFPIFNFADCCVVIGAILLLIFFFFIYSEDKKEAEKIMPQKESESAETIQTALYEDTPAGAGEDMKNAGTTDTGAGSGSGGAET